MERTIVALCTNSLNSPRLSKDVYIYVRSSVWSKLHIYGTRMKKKKKIEISETKIITRGVEHAEREKDKFASVELTRCRRSWYTLLYDFYCNLLLFFFFFIRTA